MEADSKALSIIQSDAKNNILVLPDCQINLPISYSQGTNPRGLGTNYHYQMDATYYKGFKYINAFNIYLCMFIYQYVYTYIFMYLLVSILVLPLAMIA